MYFTEIEVDIDGRGTVGQFREWIGNLISVDPHMFVIVKHYNEDDKIGYEAMMKDADLICDTYFSVKKVFYLCFYIKGILFFFIP